MARVSQLDQALLRVVAVLGSYVGEKIILCDAGRKCIFRGSVGDGILNFTFKLVTRVRHGLVSVHAGRTLRQQEGRKGRLNEGGKSAPGVGVLCTGGEGLMERRREKRSYTRLTQRVKISQAAVFHFLEHC